MNILETVEQEHAAELAAGKDIPDFQPGDTVRVGVRVVEGEKTRVQNFEGICIARKGGGVNASFTVRKISFGEGVERVLPLYGPVIDSITVVRQGRVRRAKLYYLRGRTGRAARIRERPRMTGRRSPAAAKSASPSPADNGAATATEPNTNEG